MYNIFSQRDNRSSRKFGSPNYIIHHNNIYPPQSAYSTVDSTSDCFVFRIIYYYYCLHAYCTVRLRFELVGSLNGAAHQSGAVPLSPRTWRSINTIRKTPNLQTVTSRNGKKIISHICCTTILLCRRRRQGRRQ